MDPRCSEAYSQSHGKRIELSYDPPILSDLKLHLSLKQKREHYIKERINIIIILKKVNMRSLTIKRVLDHFELLFHFE